MSKKAKSNKYALLKKQEDAAEKAEEKWIEMEEINDRRHLLEQQNRSESSEYVRFEEKSQSQGQFGDSHSQFDHGQNDNYGRSHPSQHSKQLYKETHQEPYHPKNQYRSGPHQSRYRNGGQSSNIRQSQYPQQWQRSQFSRGGQPPHQQSSIPQSQLQSSARLSTIKSLIPEMDVSCEKCTYSQSVPGNSQVYICCMCQEMNECYPLYGVFECGICRAKVVYPYGTSELIRCTRCGTVNRVAAEPKKKYLSSQLSVTGGSSQINPKRVQANSENEKNSQLNVRESTGSQSEVQSKNSFTKTSSQSQEKPFEVIPRPKVDTPKQEKVDFFAEREEVEEEDRSHSFADNAETHQQNTSGRTMKNSHPKESSAEDQNKEEFLEEEFSSKVKISSNEQSEDFFAAGEADEGSSPSRNASKGRVEEKIEYPSIFE